MQIESFFNTQRYKIPVIVRDLLWKELDEILIKQMF